MGHAFNHKRAFDIAWQQVDYNSLWIAKTLMNSAAQTEVEAALKTLRPKNFTKVQTALKASNISQVADQLSHKFKRNFTEYKSNFIRIL